MAGSVSQSAFCSQRFLKLSHSAMAAAAASALSVLARFVASLYSLALTDDVHGELAHNAGEFFAE